MKRYEKLIENLEQGDIESAKETARALSAEYTKLRHLLERVQEELLKVRPCYDPKSLRCLGSCSVCPENPDIKKLLEGPSILRASNTDSP